MKSNPFENFAKETSPGVYHALTWDVEVSKTIIVDLIELARININRKARFCLHPDSNEALQFTYLAFVAPYKDKIHSHPNRPEIIYPVFGSAVHSTFDSNATLLKTVQVNSDAPVSLATTMGNWHSLEVKSEAFVMLEIGTGPFTNTSTVYL